VEWSLHGNPNPPRGLGNDVRRADLEGQLRKSRGYPIGRASLCTLAFDVWLARDRTERWNSVVVVHQLVRHCAGLDVTGPSDQARYAKHALPVGVLL
jgi:hypothetical protein